MLSFNLAFPQKSSSHFLGSLFLCNETEPLRVEVGEGSLDSCFVHALLFHLNSFSFHLFQSLHLLRQGLVPPSQVLDLCISSLPIRGRPLLQVLDLFPICDRPLLQVFNILLGHLKLSLHLLHFCSLLFAFIEKLGQFFIGKNRT